MKKVILWHAKGNLFINRHSELSFGHKQFQNQNLDNNNIETGSKPNLEEVIVEELEKWQWEYPTHIIQETVPSTHETTVNKTGRYAVLSEDDIDKVANYCMSKNTGNEIKWAVFLFQA